MKKRLIFTLALAVFGVVIANAQNPIIRDQFTADPSAHYFEGRVYVYPSHDIPAPVDYARKDWFCMEDYHVFSSDNFVDWVDHGRIITQNAVPWVQPNSFQMWAPDCNYKDGKYYFYFPATGKRVNGQRPDGSIGVAVSDTPYGPFVPEETAIKGTFGIDPCCFIDDDGQAYLVWAGGGLVICKLKDNMKELDGDPVRIDAIPRGMSEGPFLFKANGKYYFSFPWVEAERECLAYCMADSPMGPYKFVGKIMEQHADVCWTNHHSVVEVDGQWYLFYHHNDYSPYFDKNRSVCVDSLFFNPDGTIQPVKPTKRGVGITKATSQIQIDRYSDIKDTCTDVQFVNADRTFDGWKVILNNTIQEKEPIWVRYNKVDFGKDKLTTATMKVLSLAGGKVDVRLDAIDGPTIASFNVAGNTGWVENKIPMSGFQPGIHDLFVVMTDGSCIQIDWVSFN